MSEFFWPMMCVVSFFGVKLIYETYQTDVKRKKAIDDLRELEKQRAKTQKEQKEKNLPQKPKEVKKYRSILDESESAW